MNKEDKLQIRKSTVAFEDHAIRRIYDEATDTWWFSVVDIIRVLTQQPDHQASRKYWKVLKGRLAKEGSEVVTDCYQFWSLGILFVPEGRKENSPVEHGAVRHPGSMKMPTWIAHIACYVGGVSRRFGRANLTAAHTSSPNLLPSFAHIASYVGYPVDDPPRDIFRTGPWSWDQTPQ